MLYVEYYFIFFPKYVFVLAEKSVKFTCMSTENINTIETVYKAKTHDHFKMMFFK